MPQHHLYTRILRAEQDIDVGHGMTEVKLDRRCLLHYSYFGGIQQVDSAVADIVGNIAAGRPRYVRRRGDVRAESIEIHRRHRPVCGGRVSPRTTLAVNLHTFHKRRLFGKGIHHEILNRRCGRRIGTGSVGNYGTESDRVFFDGIVRVFLRTAAAHRESSHGDAQIDYSLFHIVHI